MSYQHTTNEKTLNMISVVIQIIALLKQQRLGVIFVVNTLEKVFESFEYLNYSIIKG